MLIEMKTTNGMAMLCRTQGGIYVSTQIPKILRSRRHQLLLISNVALSGVPCRTHVKSV